MAVQSVEAVIQNSMAAEAAVAWYQSRLGFVCSASDVLTWPELATLFQWPESTKLQRWILRLGEETLQIWGWPAGAYRADGNPGLLQAIHAVLLDA